MKRFAGTLDSNVLLRLVIRNDEAQYQKAKHLIQSVNGQYAVPDIVFMEMAFVLRREYNLERLEVRAGLQGIMSFRQINCNRVMLDRALEMYVSSPALSLEDCALVVYAELNDAIPLYTFDKKLAKSSLSAKLI
jgi:predicted nucleic-acid-binding protein